MLYKWEKAIVYLLHIQWAKKYEKVANIISLQTRAVLVFGSNRMELYGACNQGD